MEIHPMKKKIHAVQFGCGPIGCAVAKLALQRPDIKLMGAVDTDRKKVGRDLGELIGLDRKLGIPITDDAEGLFARGKVDVVFHQTSSSLKTVAPQLTRLLKWGANIVSTTEELAYPYRTHPQLAAHIDKVAKANRATVLGTGINPGFLMDSWVLFMTAVCQEVKKVKAIRVQDASSRRLPFQKKIGAGCTRGEFRKLVHQGTLRHVGITESISMIAAGLGWKLDEIRETIFPVIAKKRVRSQFITVESGQAAGVRQVGRGFRGNEELITLEFEASIGAPESYDAIRIAGTPNMEVVIKGGTHGDIATAAITVNSARRVLEAPPGLITMKDLPIVTCRP
jgi:4-hydroxy-tetrahydrodipicolinate reductase